MGLQDEPLNPAQAEAVVKKEANKVAFTTIEYRKAGERLVAAHAAHRRARTIAEFDPATPRVGAVLSLDDGSTRKITVGEREAWIDRATETTALELFAAEINRENAVEMMRSARKAQDAAMGINASVREAYRSAVPV